MTYEGFDFSHEEQLYKERENRIPPPPCRFPLPYFKKEVKFKRIPLAGLRLRRWLRAADAKTSCSKPARLFWYISVFVQLPPGTRVSWFLQRNIFIIIKWYSGYLFGIRNRSIKKRDFDFGSRFRNCYSSSFLLLVLSSYNLAHNVLFVVYCECCGPTQRQIHMWEEESVTALPWLFQPKQTISPHSHFVMHFKSVFLKPSQ